MKRYAAENGTPKPAAPDNPYFPEPSLVDAVNSALILHKPLLITGEPGCGKTQLAYSVAADLGLGDPLRFDTKSVSEASHLFYNYDAIGHFRAAQIQSQGGSSDPLPHIEVQALGKAILLANPPSPESQRLIRATDAWTPVAKVVLIDEIDKAPRDFPNDLLNELENYRFRIPELSENDSIGIPPDRPDLRPIVIITSNSEKNLPEAFLRRCIYHDVPFPAESEDGSPDRLQQIVLAHVSAPEGADWMPEALEFFRFVRGSWGGRLAKMPGTAELIDLTNLLVARDLSGSLKEEVNRNVLTGVLGAILKTREDRDKGESMVKEWAKL